MLPGARSVTHIKIALLEARKPFLGCSFSNRAFSVGGTNVSGGLYCFGASIELLKKKVSEMFILLNFSRFGPENFVPLVQIGKFQKGLIEENQSYNMQELMQPTQYYADLAYFWKLATTYSFSVLCSLQNIIYHPV
jgi:hypothetical protein